MGPLLIVPPQMVAMMVATSRAMEFGHQIIGASAAMVTDPVAAGAMIDKCWPSFAAFNFWSGVFNGSGKPKVVDSVGLQTRGDSCSMQEG